MMQYFLTSTRGEKYGKNILGPRGLGRDESCPNKLLSLQNGGIWDLLGKDGSSDPNILIPKQGPLTFISWNLLNEKGVTFFSTSTRTHPWWFTALICSGISMVDLKME